MDKKNSTAPLVSVSMITYNHGRFIGRAIRSVMEQKTDFDFELIIGEDCSKDDTLELCRKYETLYPGKIRIIATGKNEGIFVNGRRTLAACTGKYTALLEGDDYWTDENKLQLQVNLLEAHPEYSACFHDGVAVNEADEVTEHHMVRFRRNLVQQDFILYGGLYPTASLMFRTNCFTALSDDFRNLNGGDRWIGIFVSGHGAFAFMDRSMCAYRKHSSGIYSTVGECVRAERQYSDFSSLYSIPAMKEKYGRLIEKKMAENLSVMAHHYALTGEKKKYREAKRKYIRYMPLTWFDFKRLLSHVLFPHQYEKRKKQQ